MNPTVRAQVRYSIKGIVEFEQECIIYSPPLVFKPTSHSNKVEHLRQHEFLSLPLHLADEVINVANTAVEFISDSNSNDNLKIRQKRFVNNFYIPNPNGGPIDIYGRPALRSTTRTTTPKAKVIVRKKVIKKTTEKPTTTTEKSTTTTETLPENLNVIEEGSGLSSVSTMNSLPEHEKIPLMDDEEEEIIEYIEEIVEEADNASVSYGFVDKIGNWWNNLVKEVGKGWYVVTETIKISPELTQKAANDIKNKTIESVGTLKNGAMNTIESIKNKTIEIKNEQKLIAIFIDWTGDICKKVAKLRNFQVHKIVLGRKQRKF